MSLAREEILARIRAAAVATVSRRPSAVAEGSLAVGADPPHDAQPSPEGARGHSEGRRDDRARSPGSGRDNAQPQRGERASHEIIEQFAEYCADYRANVVRVSAADATAEIARLLAARGSARVVIPSDLPPDLRPEGAIEDSVFDNLTLDAFQAVVTTCAVAIAETGTIVLDAGPGQGRRALTLIPDHHVCVVREKQIVESVPQAVALLEGAVKDGRPLTWISGPSATSDIELNRVEGVHGPRILDVVLVAE